MNPQPQHAPSQYRWRIATLVLCSTFLLFFHPILAFNPRDLIDDQCYLRWLSRFLFFPYDACPNPYTFPGTALLWVPLGAVARLLSILTTFPLLEALTTSIGISSYVFWCLSLWTLFKIAERVEIDESKKIWMPILLLFSIPALHYATARSTMAHTGELFLSLLVLDFLLRRRHAPAIGVALLLCATRINDIPILFVVIAHLLDERADRRRILLTVSIATVALLPALYIALFSYYGGGSGLIPVLREVNFREFLRVTFQGQYALLYSATFWLFALVMGTRYLSRISWAARTSLAWMAFLYAICMGWGGMGNAFGYRYLIGTYPFAFLVWFELQKTGPRWTRPVGIALLGWNALWLTHLTWVYDHNSSWFEILGQAGGFELLKQGVHPLMRWIHFSPLALTMKYLMGRTSEGYSFLGPFVAKLSPYQVRATVFLTAICLTTFGITLLQLLKIRLGRTSPRRQSIDFRRGFSSR